MNQVLTKKIVAQRQLVTAIRLHLSNGDAVSVVSLASNAWEIIDYFCRANSVLSMSEQARGNLPPPKRLKVDYINLPYRNFFKHAENDSTVELPPMDAAFVDGLVYLAVEDYLRWSKKGPVELQVFQLWYLSIYIEKVAKDDLPRITAASELKFHGIRDLPRQAQLELGLRVLREASADDELMRDARTEI